MGLLFLIVGDFLLGCFAYSLSKKLFKEYPFGSKKKFWWSKYLPTIGFGLILIAAGSSTLALLPGFIVLFSGLFFLRINEADTKESAN